MNLEQQIEQRIANAEKLKKGINFEWFRRFFAMLEKSGVKEEIILQTMDYSLSEDGLSRITAKGNSGGFGKDLRDTPRMLNEFFSYMSNMAQEYGAEKFCAFLENTLSQIKDEYEDYKKYGHSKRTTLKNLFLKHLVLENPKDVYFEYTGTPLESFSAEDDLSIILLKIAGMEIGDIKFEEAKGNPPTVQFLDFRTLSGLEKMGLGSHLFIEFCKQMVEHKKGYPIIAWNVMKGHDGEKVYSKWGAYPVKCSVENDIWEFDTTPLTEEEAQDYFGDQSRVFYFSPEIIKNISQQPNNRYGKQEQAKGLTM